MRVPLPRRMGLDCARHLREFFEWYKKQVEKDLDYGKKRKPRKHK